MLNQREIAAVVGPAGSGKSALLREIVGWHPAPRARVLLAGVDPAVHPLAARSRAAFCDGRGGLAEHLTVRRNVEMVLRACGLAVPDRRIVESALRRSDLPDACFDRRAGALSAGQQIFVSIAIARLRRVPLLLLDDPLARLTRDEITPLMQMLLDVRDGEMTTMVATRELTFALRIADRVWTIDNGLLAERKRTRFDDAAFAELLAFSNFADVAHHGSGNHPTDRGY